MSCPLKAHDSTSDSCITYLAEMGDICPFPKETTFSQVTSCLNEHQRCFTRDISGEVIDELFGSDCCSEFIPDEQRQFCHPKNPNSQGVWNNFLQTVGQPTRYIQYQSGPGKPSQTWLYGWQDGNPLVTDSMRKEVWDYYYTGEFTKTPQAYFYSPDWSDAYSNIRTCNSEHHCPSPPPSIFNAAIHRLHMGPGSPK